MRPSLAFVLGVSLVGIVVACSSSERTGFGDAPPPVDEAGAPPPALGGDAANTLTVNVNISGTVYAPNGTLPLSNALVYVTSEPPAAIPDGAYCDQCVKIQEGTFAVSAPDGKFEIKTDLPKGKVYVVVQKGQFRRVRPLDIEKEGAVDLSKDETTLPGRSDPSKGDDIPKMVVLKDDADFDVIDESLKKLGITEFDVKTDRSLLLDETGLDKYHVVFIPCGMSEDETSTSPQAQANMQAYVAKGGKLYVTDWSYEFVRQPFPGFLSWEGETATLGSAASGDEWDAPATAADQGLADWLAATGDSTFTVEDTIIHGINDKAVSMTNGSATFRNLLVYDAGQGIRGAARVFGSTIATSSPIANPLEVHESVIWPGTIATCGPDVSYTLVGNGGSLGCGVGNLSANPQFTAPQQCDYTPEANSPAMTAGPMGGRIGWTGFPSFTP